MISSTDISGYLNAIEQQNKKDWSWSHVDDKGFWRVKHSGSLPSCEICVSLNEPSLCLHVDLGEFRIKPECRPALHLFLLRLNEELPIVKFGAREGGKISLMAEAVASQMKLEAFEELLQVVIAVFSQYRREIELVATETALADFITNSFKTKDGSAVSVTVVEREPTRP